jgi:hypothetical protein
MTISLQNPNRKHTNFFFLVESTKRREKIKIKNNIEPSKSYGKELYRFFTRTGEFPMKTRNKKIKTRTKKCGSINRR